MAFPRNSLRAFLTHAKSSLHSAQKQNQKLTLVIGNESADLDSLTSSLLYAYIRSSRPPPACTLYIPLLHIPSSDLPLRPEFTALCSQANISPAHLITLDDIPPPSILPSERTRWVLVDHNRFQGGLGDVYKTRVVGVVDHHDDEGAIPTKVDGEGNEPEPWVIEKCGSCTSLVVRELRGTWDQLPSATMSSGASHGQAEDGGGDDAAVMGVRDAQAAKMALASILVDTRNLSDGSKTMDTDREAVEYLEAKIKGLGVREEGGWDRERFYEEIDKAKADIGRLQLGDIFRKDYKEWTEAGMKLGISSVVKPLEFLAKKAGEEEGWGGTGGDAGNVNEAFDKALASFIASRNLALFAIMTTSTSPSGTFQRQLLLQTTQKASRVAEHFETTATRELDFQHISDELGIRGYSEEERWRKVWQQRNVGASRKQVAPLLRKAMAGN
ncbi:Exopolyphosphatase [Trapelia coarctata]|nr:Exopolyphosphatase [Trapelia coarctata]